MSWLFSRALVEACSGANSSGGEQSALSNGNHTPQAYLSPDRMTGFLRLSRSGMTFEPLTADRGEALLTLFLEGFHARTSASPVKETASTEKGQDSGEKWRGWLAKYDPATSSWKTAQCSLISEEAESLQTLPRSGMTRDGLLWEQPTLVRPIKETGSGWWPTPAARDYKGANGFQRTQEKLAQGKGAQMGQLPNAVQQALGRPIGGTLNPDWTEWLMGWPSGWTDLRPLATDKYPSVQQQHGQN